MHRKKRVSWRINSHKSLWCFGKCLLLPILVSLEKLLKCLCLSFSWCLLSKMLQIKYVLLFIARNKCCFVSGNYVWMNETNIQWWGVLISEFFKIWQAKPFEIANINKRPDCLLQMDAFPNVTLVNKAAFELQERTRVKETALLPRNRDGAGRKSLFCSRAKIPYAMSNNCG